MSQVGRWPKFLIGNGKVSKQGGGGGIIEFSQAGYEEVP